MAKLTSGMKILPFLLAGVASPSGASNFEEGALQVPPGPGLVASESQCGPTTDWQDVETYDGTLGADRTSVEFVERHQAAVGNLKWTSNFRAGFTNAGTIPNDQRWCSGTLISPTLFITAGHCFDPDTNGWTWPRVNGTTNAITPQQGARLMEVAFNYQNDASGAPLPETRYAVTSLTEYRLGGLDYAILTLAGRPGDDWAIARPAAHTPQPGDDLTIIQHPGGAPKVVDSGTVSSTTATTISYGDIDTIGGTSGAGVLDWQGRLIGVHTNGGCDSVGTNRGVLVEAIASVSPLLAQQLAEVGEHGEAVVSGDFDGNGFPDLAVGRPTRTNTRAGADQRNAGGVRVIYAKNASGPDNTTATWLTQDTSGVAGATESGDFFGATLVVGKFNGDRYDDLAVGSPGEAIGSEDNAGSVVVFYGSASGLTGTDSASFSQDSEGVPGVAEANDRMGSALAAADFNKDGYADLAIGAPNEAVDGAVAAGSVTVLYGSSSGVTATGSQAWHQNTAGIAGENENGDRFGSSLAVGDLDKDTYQDLVIGIPYEDLANNAVDAGSVLVLYGSNQKLAARDSIRFDQSGDLAGAPERGDRFGFAVAVGDVNGDTYGDAIVGVPGEDIENAMHAGMINVLYGASAGLSASRTNGLSQDTDLVVGVSEAEDRMGMSLAAANVNRSTPATADVLVGIPGEAVGDVVDAGTLLVLYGRGGELNGALSAMLDQNSDGVAGGAEQGDRFATAVSARDMNKDGYADALILVPGEQTSDVANQDIVHLLFGSSSGLVGTGSLLY